MHKRSSVQFARQEPISSMRNGRYIAISDLQSATEALMVYVNIEDSDQPVHPRNLIIALFCSSI